MTTYTLYIKFNPEMDEEIQNYYLNYKSKHVDDSGLDLPTVCDTFINTYRDKCSTTYYKSIPVNFGISCCMKNNNTNKCVGYYLYPRSSFHKYNLIVANHLGIIDAGYRGPITGMVKPLHLTELSNVIRINKGDKLFQLCSPDLSPFNIQIVNELPESSRGEDGFGSTGK